jgi:chemotaxis protein MotC
LRFVVVILVGLVSLSFTTHAETARRADPHEMVRVLSALQTRMSYGDNSARAATTKQLEQTEQVFGSIEPQEWKDPKNTRAAVTYLLGGGAPHEIRKLLDAGYLPENDRALVSGSLAYAEGRRREAAKLLQNVDPRKYLPTLGGHLALVQGGLLMGFNRAQALRLFDLARLLMPGSLVEEAALRREISIVDGAHEPGKLTQLARRYAAQYSGSLYIQNFWDELSAATVRAALSLDEARLTELEGLLRGMDTAAKFDFYLAIARKAILNARMALADLHTKKAEPFAQTVPARLRVKFYNSIIGLISGTVENGLAEIQSVDTRSLPRADIEMRNIVVAAMKQLESSSNEDSPKSQHARGRADEEVAGTDGTDSPVEKSARQAIAEADALLERASGR